MIDGLNDESSQMSDVRVTVIEMATGKWAELSFDYFEMATGKWAELSFDYFYTFPNRHLSFLIWNIPVGVTFIMYSTSTLSITHSTLWLFNVWHWV